MYFFNILASLDIALDLLEEQSKRLVTIETLITFLENINLNIHSDPSIKRDKGQHSQFFPCFAKKYTFFHMFIDTIAYQHLHDYQKVTVSGSINGCRWDFHIFLTGVRQTVTNPVPCSSLQKVICKCIKSIKCIIRS